MSGTACTLGWAGGPNLGWFWVSMAVLMHMNCIDELVNKQAQVCIYIAYCMHPISHHKDTGADGDVTANHRRHDNGSDSECISDHNTYKSDGKEWRVF